MTKEELKEIFRQYDAIKIAFFGLKLPYDVVNKNYSARKTGLHLAQHQITGPL